MRLAAMEATDLVAYSLEAGEAVLSQRAESSRKRHGQYLTPAPVARFMARQLEPVENHARVLDPALGSGVLACAVIEQVIARGQPDELWIDGYEIDPELLTAAEVSLQRATERAASRGVTVHVGLRRGDFILEALPMQQPGLFAAPAGDCHPRQYDRIIANPPYFKLHRDDPRVVAASRQLHGHTNLYTLFMALAVELLADGGRACFIVPRSFCSGAYFSDFRRAFLAQTVPEAVHLFESREDTFRDALQENVIITFSRRQASGKPAAAPEAVAISTSGSGSDLRAAPRSRKVAFCHFQGQQNGALFFRLPTGELDEALVEAVDGWKGSLARYGLQVSTGPVVPFRARALLVDDLEQVARGLAAPLLWMHHVKPQRITWPAGNGAKPRAIALNDQAMKLLVPAGNFVVLRRFSAKEEPRRLIAAPFLVEQHRHAWVGLENHLNYIYRSRGQLDPDEAVGLSALLNSGPVDRYVRILNGNTQVNAAELRALPLPPMETIRQIGRRLLAAGEAADIDRTVFAALEEAGCLPPEFPIIRETRITMGKIQEAQEVLRALGLPEAQQNEISALTLLALAQLSEATPWGDARRQSLRVHDMLAAIKARYGREYAENTRETIRRQALHQFEQAALVVRNPDDPSLPTNSPKTHYTLTDAALRAIRRYGTAAWEEAAQTFVADQGALLDVYRRSLDRHKVPLRLPGGEAYRLSPGRHNELQVAVVEEFGPRFAPGAQVLYLGDTADKTLIFDRETLATLGVPMASHAKLPGVVLYDEARNRLFLVEVVTAHGLVSPKRHLELEALFGQCPARRVYVSVFPDFATFKSFLTEVAWETEVWLAELPNHLIHFNGDRFL